MIKTLGYYLLFASILVLGVVGSVALAEWVDPSVAPPGGNAEPPINTSDTGQIKDGGLAVGGLFRALSYLLVGGFSYDTISGTLILDVEGPAGAQQYCDDDGANCVSGNLRNLVTAGSGIEVTQVINGPVAQTQVSLAGSGSGSGSLACEVSSCEWVSADNASGYSGPIGIWATLQYVCPSEKPILSGLDLYGKYVSGSPNTLAPAFESLSQTENQGNRLYCCSLSCSSGS